jgi:hypothetical protein
MIRWQNLKRQLFTRPEYPDRDPAPSARRRASNGSFPFLVLRQLARLC